MAAAGCPHSVLEYLPSECKLSIQHPGGRLSTVHSPEYQKLLKRLRAARLAARMSQNEAATRLQRTQAYVSKCESGERRIDAVELKQFAQLYHTTVAQLLGESR